MVWLKRALVFSGALGSAYLGMSAALALSISRRGRRTRAQDDLSSVGLTYRDISFASRRDAIGDPVHQLKGWMVPPMERDEEFTMRDYHWLVIVHGDGANRSDPQVGAMWLAKSMWDLGYGILMFDLRGCGESDEGAFSGGWNERLDVLGALDYLVAQGADRSRIAVLGFSLGAVASTLACANPGVAGAVIADSAYSDFWPILERRVGLKSAGAELMRPGLDLMLQMLFGYRLGEVSPEKNISEFDTPVFIIHGGKDDLIPMVHAQRLARARGLSQTDIDSGDCDGYWINEDAGHAQSFRTDPTGYVNRVSAFLNRHLVA